MQAGEQPIASPCVSLCALDEQREYCLGCHRSLDEIRAWRSMSNADKLQVLQALATRKQA